MTTPMVEVFKTNVVDTANAEKITLALTKLAPIARLNFDLKDCDRILRVEVLTPHAVALVQEHLQSEGFMCEPLE